MIGPLLLSVEDVAVDLRTPRGNLRAVDHVDLTLGAGKTLGIVGESGSGKTMLSRAILQLLPKKAKQSGRVIFDGQDLARCSEQALRKLRARSIAVVFQDPVTSLNPVLTIGTQLTETLQEHLEFELDCGETAQRGTARLGRHSCARTTSFPISAPAFGRHAPARSDLDRTVLRAKTPDRGRADHRARTSPSKRKSSIFWHESSAAATWR